MTLPANFNYIGVFLTYACNFKCPWCLNREGKLAQVKSIPVDDLIKFINALDIPPDIPITLQGGEPTCYPHLYKLINSIKPEINIDMLTNGNFDHNEFMAQIDHERMYRNAPYASIRFSYHPGVTNKYDLLKVTTDMQRKGYSVGVWAVNHPNNIHSIRMAHKMFTRAGIDFRLKEFLGEYEGKLYGTYMNSSYVHNAVPISCKCKGSELLISPSGNIHRCHRDLYANEGLLGNIRDMALPPKLGKYLSCPNLGSCNPCDVKIKFNRHQQMGHSSVEINLES